MSSVTVFTLTHSLPPEPEFIYQALLDFSKFGEMHPNIRKVSITNHQHPDFIEYAVEEEFVFFGIFRNYPRYQAKVTEVEKHKHLRYSAVVKKSVTLTINFFFSENKNTLLVTENIEISSNKLVAMVFGKILRKAHIQVFGNLKKALNTAN